MGQGPSIFVGLHVPGVASGHSRDNQGLRHRARAVGDGQSRGLGSKCQSTNPFEMRVF